MRECVQIHQSKIFIKVTIFWFSAVTEQNVVAVEVCFKTRNWFYIRSQQKFKCTSQLTPGSKFSGVKMIFPGLVVPLNLTLKLTLLFTHRDEV